MKRVLFSALFAAFAAVSILSVMFGYPTWLPILLLVGIAAMGIATLTFERSAAPASVAVLLMFGLVSLVAPPVLAQFVTRGMETIPLPLTGDETTAFDTNLTQGRNPQTGKLTILQMQGLSPVTLTDATTITPSGTAGNMFRVTLGGNRTIANFSPAPAAESTFKILVIQDFAGSRTVTWGSLFKWFGGSAPTLTSTGTRGDMITCLYDSAGSGYYLCDKQLNVTP